jgi:hypothetical protein
VDDLDPLGARIERRVVEQGPGRAMAFQVASHGDRHVGPHGIGLAGQHRRGDNRPTIGVED